MSKLCVLITNMAFIALFVLSSWNNLQEVQTSSERFSQKYGVMQDKISYLSGLEFHPQIHKETVSANAVAILTAICYTVIFLSISSIMISKLGVLASIMWLLMQLLELEVAGFSAKTPLMEIEQLALVFAIFTGALLSFRCASSGCETKVKTD